MANRTNGNNGGYFLEATTTHTGLKVAILEINADAVFTTLTLTYKNSLTDSALTADMLLTTAPYGQNLSGRTVTAGRKIYAPENGYFSAITMSSGSAYGIKSDLAF